MKVSTHMTLRRQDKELRVRITGMHEPAAAEGPESVENIEAWDYDGEVCLTESEWREAEEALLLEARERP